MTPRFKHNPDGSYEIGEPSEREGLCEILRNGVAEVVFGHRSPNDRSRICKHMIALSFELAKVDQAFSQAVRDGIAEGASREYDPAKMIRVVSSVTFDEGVKVTPYTGPSGEVKPKTFGEMNPPPEPIVETIVDDEAAAIKAVSDLLKIYESDTWRQSGRELRAYVDFVQQKTRDMPAHDFTEEEIEAVKAWTDRFGYSGVLSLFSDGVSSMSEAVECNNGVPKTISISNNRVRAIARYLAEKEE